MSHESLGLFIIFLGIVELLAYHFKIRIWIFTRAERQVLKEKGEDAVFRRRFISGLIGVSLGVITYLFGNF